jgi:hypothetical protein
VLAESERPHPRCPDRCGVNLEDPTDDSVIGEHVEVVFHSPDGREAEARLRIREDMPQPIDQGGLFRTMADVAKLILSASDCKSMK